MKYGAGGLISQIATAATEMKILMSKTMNVPISAFLASLNNVDIANERAMAVLIQTNSTMMIGPGLRETISSRKATAMSRKIIVATPAERAKSTY